MKRIKTLFILLLLLFAITPQIQAAEPTGNSYFYNSDGTAIVCPPPYTAKNVIGYELGLLKPGDMMAYNQEIYILDLADGKITVLDNNYQKNRVIVPSKDGQPFAFSEPKGFWVAEQAIFIADRSAQSIIKCDFEGNVTTVFGKPKIGNDDSKSDYLPLDVITDSLGNIYVLVENEYRGLVVTDKNGDFKGYFGANTVEATYQVIMDNLWRTYFLTETQIEATSRNLPSPYISIFEKEGFIYASNSGKTGKLHKLNYNGNNILSPTGKSGTCDSEADSSFVSVTADDEGFFSAIDSYGKNVFQYDAEGNLLFAFGGFGSQAGCFIEPSSICNIGNDILVLDASGRTITVFEPTEFGNSVRMLKKYETEGKYNEAATCADSILSLCNEYETAYFSLGEQAYSRGEYEDAMSYFRLCGNKEGFSKAFAEKRTAILRDAFPFIMLAVVLLVILNWALKKFGKNEKKSTYYRVDPEGKLKYAFYTVLHPIEGFAELRYNKRYSMPIANALYAIAFLLSMINFVYTGFSFSSKDATDFNILIQLDQTVGVMLLFVISNRLVATFLGGVGNIREIWITVGYAQIPMIFGNIMYTLLSNLLTQEEGVFLGYLLIILTAYSYIMIFFAVMGVNMYSFGQCVFAVICTLFGMVVCIFLIFLTFNLSVELLSFFETVFREIVYRINVGF